MVVESMGRLLGVDWVLAANARAQSVAFDSLLDASGARARQIVDQRLDSLRISLKSEIDERMARCGVCAEAIGATPRPGG